MNASDFFEKVSSYNIFNCLLPGILFAIIGTQISSNYYFLQDDLLTGAFLYYFIGLVISRVGSIVIEPILKKVHFLKLNNYEHFLAASKKDLKLEILSEASNTYRTLLSLILMLFALKLYEWGEWYWEWLYQYDIYILLGFLLLLFLFSYRKQSVYISKRIQVNNS